MTTPSIKEALEIVENLIRRDPACFNMSDELLPVRAALRAIATLSPPAGERREAIARLNRLIKVMKASFASGQPMSVWSDDLQAVEILASGLVQDEAAIRKDEREKLRNRIDSYLNDFLCGMKEGWDDSVSGFNDAWDVVRKVFDAAAIRSARDGGAES